jgi:hypothetical protein
MGKTPAVAAGYQALDFDWMLWEGRLDHAEGCSNAYRWSL